MGCFIHSVFPQPAQTPPEERIRRARGRFTAPSCEHLREQNFFGELALTVKAALQKAQSLVSGGLPHFLRPWLLWRAAHVWLQNLGFAVFAPQQAHVVSTFSGLDGPLREPGCHRAGLDGRDLAGCHVLDPGRLQTSLAGRRGYRQRFRRQGGLHVAGGGSGACGAL